MRNFILFILAVFSLQAISQTSMRKSNDPISERFTMNMDKKLEKYELQNLKEMEAPAMRIWNTNSIITFGSTSEFTLLLRRGQENELTRSRSFQNQTDLNTIVTEIRKYENLEGNMNIAIDVAPTTIELFTPEDGYSLISFYSNSEVRELIKKVFAENNIQEIRKNLIQELPVGNYGYGMSSLHIDHLIADKEKQSDFYKEIFPEIAEKLEVSSSTSVLKMPIIVINGAPKDFAGLNELKKEQVSSYQILSSTKATALYGYRAAHGVILIKTH